MNILGVITARGGSKGIPGKNIKFLGGKPLIAWTIEAAKKSKLITHLIVSTDDAGIAEIAKRYGADVPFVRPKELAEDKTPHLPVMQHALRFMEEKLKMIFDAVVILQPTSPLRTAADIDETLAKLVAHPEATSAVSLVAVPDAFHPLKMKKLDGERVLPYCMSEPEGTRRQDFPPVYKRSSAVYAIRRATLLADRLYGDHIVGHIVPPERFIDIDTLEDWEEAEARLRAHTVH